MNPLSRVREWFEEAAASGIVEAERMALATATPDGRPSVRIVLLKGIDDDGIRFFTNYGSRKARELDANPRAAATLYWQPLYRAARLEGPVERLSAEESDAYFATRPRGAQVGAWASAQGTVLGDRAELEERVRRGRGSASRTRCRAPTSGAATASGPTPSSSGRAAPTACTTASTSCARRTAAGAPSGSRRRYYAISLVATGAPGGEYPCLR